MYGLVNKAIKDLVTENHGDEAWEKVCEIAEISRVTYQYEPLSR